MNKDQVKNEILKIKDWRHPYELEPGLWVDLHRQWHKDWHLWRIETLMPTIGRIAGHLFPNGLKDARVLDTGCWDGFYGFEFLKRGASYLKGIDLRDEAIRRANLIKDYFGFSPCDFVKENIQDIDTNAERFDITLMYGILYHLSAPIDVIKKLGEMTGSMMLINTYAYPGPDPVIKLKREDPDKDSTGFQELISIPSEKAVVEMLDFAGFTTILRHYPYPFYEKYKDAHFGFFYAVKSTVPPVKVDAVLKDLEVREAYDPGLKCSQVVRLEPVGKQSKTKPRFKERLRLKLHTAIDKMLSL